MSATGLPEMLTRTTVRFTLGDPGISHRLKLKNKLPPLLEKRRKEFAIPDACFRRVAMFDRALLYQITDADADKAAPGSMLFAPETSKDRAKREAPRGVVISAGLAARDYLWANGADLGSIVNFVRLSPWRLPVGTVHSQAVEVHVVRVGDIVAVEDLSIEAHCVVLDEKKALHQLRIDGKVRPRADVDPSDDY